MKKKISIAFGTRPEVIKLWPLIIELKKQPEEFDLRIISTAQHRELKDQMTDLFEIEPDVDFDLMKEKQDLVGLQCLVMQRMQEELRAQRPDLLIVQGDTTTVLGCAQAGFYEKVPVGHVEAGIRSGDIMNPFPEEMVRSVVARFATYHFCPSELARENLIREGVDPERIFVPGNTVIYSLDVALDQEGKVTPQVQDLLASKKPYVLVTAHRRESFGKSLEEIFEGIARAAKRLTDHRFVYPVHPNPAVRETAQSFFADSQNVDLIEPQDYFSFIHLMKNADLLVSDSGGVQEEALYLKKPLLVIRERSDRPETVSCGAAKLIGVSADRIEEEVLSYFDGSSELCEPGDRKNVYGDESAPEKIVDFMRQWL